MNADLTTPESRRLQYLNVVISEKGLAEMSGNRRIILIPKDQVQSIEIRHGLQAERPLVQGITGLAFIGLGAVGIYIMVEGGIAALRWALGFLVFGGLGAWLLWEATKQGHYLKIICLGDSRKLVFKGKIQTEELSGFIRSASQFGYTFRDCLNDKNFK